MGRQAKKRKENRIHLLKRLAVEDPRRFLEEWDARIQSWMYAIWAEANDEARFTEDEYNDFIRKYPHAHRILAPVIRHDGRFCVILGRVRLYHQEELGTAAFNELLKHVNNGVLRGRSLFAFVEKAKEILIECGADEPVVRLAIMKTQEILGNECCQAIARSVGLELHRLNGTYERKYVGRAS